VIANHPRRSGFPAIADYGFLSDCETAALVAPDSSVEWLCLPRFDSPSVFGSILDRDAGHFHFGPRRVTSPIARRYLPGTNVIGTDWMGADGWLAVRNALLVEADPVEPRDCRALRALVRVATCQEGEANISLDCSPRFSYGRETPEWRDDGGVAVAEHEGVRVRLTASIDLQIDGGTVRAEKTLREGEACFCCLSWGDEAAPQSVDEARTAIEVTSRFWRSWIQGGKFPDHAWSGHLQRAALTLKGLSYQPTGALIAAATTSLPEAPGGGRNWDYRYTWVRDATFSLWALHALGLDHEARDYLGFVTGLMEGEGPDPQIMFGIGGETELPESALDHLSGYRGAQPVRIGNGAADQRQNDVYGAFLDSVYIQHKVDEGLPEGIWPVARDQVEGALAVWRDPDQGIWESRGDPCHYVSSKLMSWVALDRGARLAQEHAENDNVRRFRAAAEEVRADLLANGVSERGTFRQHYGTDALDASTLLIPLVRFLPASDERVRNTVLAIADELTEDGLVLRYRPEESDDGVSREREGTFTTCSFWLVSALCEIGEGKRAQELCGRLISMAGPLGLYAEELDAASGEHLGNFPQAFTHLGLINALLHVIAEEEAGERAGHSAVLSETRSRHGVDRLKK